MTRFAALLLACFAMPAGAAISLNLAPNYDDTRSTAYPSGDKPVVSCTPPSGYTEVNLGDGAGEICEQSATEFDLNVSGSSQTQDNHLMHKDGNGGDVQIEARITNTYAGSAESFASVGVGIREAATQAAWFFQVHSLQSGAAAVQVTYGSDGVYTSVNEGAGQSRPRYVCLTYDVSTGDIKGFAGADGSTWTEVASTNQALADDEVYLFGASRSATETLQATVDNYVVGSTIDCYTPGGGGGGGPTLVSQIENQSAAEGVAFSLSIAANFSGETAYSIGTNALPSGSGLSLNTSSGVLSGTPDADDVTASPFELDLCASNTGGTTCDTIQFTVSAVPGDIINISSAATFDCDTGESGGRVDPGDILVIPGGTRGPLTIENCAGTPAAPIIIRNDVTDNEPAVIRRTSGSSAVLTLSNMTNFELDGTGKFVGADSGDCGHDPVTDTFGTTQCGIVVEATGGSGGFTIRMDGLTCTGSVNNPGFCTIKGVEVTNGGYANTGISMNDKAELFSEHEGGPGTDDDLWRENITIENNYIHDIGDGPGSIGEGMYIGPNPDAVAPDLSLRNVAIRYNYLLNIARDCINTKSIYDGTNYYEYNYGENCGESNEGTQNRALNLLGAADYIIRGNRMIDHGGEGLTMYWQDIPGHSPNASNTVLIENNVFANVGTTPASDGHGALFNRQSSAPTHVVTMRNNTIAGTTGDGVVCNGNSTVNVSNSIIVGVSGSAVSVVCDGNTNNRTGTIASQDFADEGNDDYELTATSDACSESNSSAPDIDVLVRTRPEGAGRDQGAYESPACP